MINMCSTPVKQSRKIRKPLMEKKRRDRINECLEQLKNFILDQKENLKDKKPSKLEKADILELTVKILRRLHDKVINETRGNDITSERLLEINDQLEYRLSGENMVQLQPGENYSDERFAAGYRACMKRVRVLLDKRFQDSIIKSSNINRNSLIHPHLRPAKETTNLIQNNDEFQRRINSYYNDETHTTNSSSRSNSPMDYDESYGCYTNPRLCFDENSTDFSHRSSPSSVVLESPHDDQHLSVPLRTNLNTTICQSNTSSQHYPTQDNTGHRFNENQTLQKKDMWRPW